MSAKTQSKRPKRPGPENEDKLNAARYEHVRTMRPVDFVEIWGKSAFGGESFDDLVDAQIAQSATRRRAVNKAASSRRNTGGLSSGYPNGF